MAKILNLIIQDRSDPKTPHEFVESFEIREDVQNPEKALREAIQEFVNSGTDQSRAALSYACGCFNWGDVFSNVPDELFIKHGLTPLKQNAVDVFVDHNEILVSNTSDDPMAEIKNIIKKYIQKGEKEITHWLAAENLVAENIADNIAIQNDKLKSLLILNEINEQIIMTLIESETDDNLVSIYEDIIDEIADITLS